MSKKKNIVLGALLALMASQQLHAIDLSGLSLKGDLRVREQWESLGSGGDHADRYRTRLRLRIGSELKLDEKTSAEVQFATGSSTDPRSNNQTMGHQYPAVVLSLAQIQYSPLSSLKLFAGKMRNPIWFAEKDWLVDGDINPEGLALQYDASSFVSGAFVNALYASLYEQATTRDDSYQFTLQTGLKKSLSGVEVTTALAYMNLSNLKGKATTGGNTTASGLRKNEYSPIVLSAQIKKANVLGLESMKVFAEYALNTEAKDYTGYEAAKNNQGYIFGVGFGADKLNKKGLWQGVISYRVLQADAIADIFPDSDANSGKTNTKALKLSASYALTNLSAASFAYFASESRSSGVKTGLLQVDYNVRF